MIAGSLEIQMTANMARLQADMDTAKRSVGNAMGSIERSVGAARSALMGLGSGFTVGSIAIWTKGLIDAADDINDLSQRIGISVRDLGGWQLAAEQSGASLEAIGKGIKALAPTMQEFGKEFAALGVSTSAPNQALIDLADIISAMPDGFEKNALAVKLFGKAGVDLIPLLNLGSSGLTEARVKAEKYAAALEKLAPQADAFNDALKEFDLLVKGQSMGLLTDQIKGATGLIAFFTDATSGVDGFRRAMGFLADDLPIVFAPIKLLAGGLEKLAEMKQSFDAYWKDRQGLALFTGLPPPSASNAAAKASAGARPGGLSPEEELALGDKNEKVLVALRLANLLNQRKSTGGGASTDPLGSFMAGLRERIALSNAELEADGKLSEAQKSRISDEAKLAEILKKHPELSKAKAKAMIYEAQESAELLAIKREDERYSNEAAKRQEAAFEAAQREAESIEQATKSMQDQNAEMGLGTEALVRLKQARIDDQIATIQLNKAWQEAIGTGPELLDLCDRQIKALEGQKHAMEESMVTSRDWAYGMRDAMNQYIDVTASAANQSRNFFTSAFKSMEDAMVQFIKTGKLDFASFADSIISDLIRIQVQQNITKPLAKAFGGASSAGKGFDATEIIGRMLIPDFSFANGGIMSSYGALPLHKYASGGIASSPQLAVFGEGRMNEAFVPLPDGRSIPVQMRGGGGGSISITMPVTINAPGASSDVVPMIQQGMAQVLQQMRRELPALVRQQQMRNGVTPYRA